MDAICGVDSLTRQFNIIYIMRTHVVVAKLRCPSLTKRDVNRLRILQDVIDRNLRPGLAAEMLGITPRHCSRLLKRYRQSGPLGMNNQSRGRTGNRLLSASLTDQALNIIRERYADFGPTLTWEKLAENHGLLMSL